MTETKTIAVFDANEKVGREFIKMALEVRYSLGVIVRNRASFAYGGEPGAVRDLSGKFLQQSNLPPKASDDAVHIAAATVHGLDYLLTWNSKHIANAQIQRKLAEISLDCGYELPIICTPYELLGG